MTRAIGGGPVKLKYLVIPAALALAGCNAQAAENSSSTVASTADLASLLEGEFTTAPSAADPESAGAPSPANTLYVLSKRVDVPSLAHDVVYMEERSNSHDGPILWQRLDALRLDEDTGRITMTPYGFANQGQLAGAPLDAKPLATLKPADVKQIEGGCVVTWRRTEDGFAGMGQPGPCPGAKPDNSANPAPVLTVTKTSLTDGLESKNGDIVFRRVR
jgi:hypothetical protein